MRKYLRIVDNHRATKGQRFGNYIIDLISFYIVYFMFGGILLIISPAFNHWISNSSELSQRLMGILSYISYCFLMESITGGRSIGKLITGTKVIMIDGSKPKIGNFFVRNIIRGIILVDQLSFFGENGLHDSWSETRVINIKNYESEKQVKSEIEGIGAKEIV
ncbi:MULTISPECIES: RDD family protein [Chryseobacterium]|uniref:RDD family membrane protein YckC n=1 Tax=Chryseobacterium geocarposphaerae TaxID=1416776 RepID=A0ABU1LD03_9FLAO|nr:MULTISPECIES: RDD family protein [Chryseobacterium]ALR31243.1 hypothetical protein ATE47_12245 [Chryseobacterium sp. IHB B 17019]MDR6404584.1 putative RDD family membrane protein YckC [Chryseobacterium geocarposphaerae]MDR6698183.1 putative RDD family membrane protein YckC [Chryseobacterium ginsenosidimutans]